MPFVAKEWSAVDAFFEGALLEEEPVLDDVLAKCAAAGLPEHQVSPPQAKFLYLLTKLRGARRVLEIGTLGGYSGIWFARAVPPDGEVVTIEVEPTFAELAAENFAAAGVADKIDLKVGDANDVLPSLLDGPPFDLVFVDADKKSNVAYLEWTLALTRPGAAIVLDNVARAGAVADPDSTDPSVLGTRAALDWIGRCPRLEATALQTVGTKGYDGFALALVRERRAEHDDAT
eukprot:CAMPEP_0198662964 /NCGR_PEP_ID=MMETSP1467-20131203/49863_1 /TAXON_ID=1462469 /ORGANISM="unid. sp., Strain CCMP2135" /LENGTH=231 /DNA_ID=CAMNT_0044399469 /DNA_START=89 /DNA_END=784 /DNA_ORIENTATION=-